MFTGCLLTRNWACLVGRGDIVYTPVTVQLYTTAWFYVHMYSSNRRATGDWAGLKIDAEQVNSLHPHPPAPSLTQLPSFYFLFSCSKCVMCYKLWNTGKL